MRWRGLSSVIAAFLVIVGSWKGYLALFDPGKEEPKQIFPRQIVTLPGFGELAGGLPVLTKWTVFRPENFTVGFRTIFPLDFMEPGR